MRSGFRLVQKGGLMPQRPLVIFVTGLPATGKSSIATQIATQLQLPLFTKDQFKELLFDTMGIGDRAWSKRLGVASVAMLMRVIEGIVAAGQSCIAESNFHPELDLPRLLAIQAHSPFRVAQVLCVSDGAVLHQRFRDRIGQRHPGHLDELLIEELAPVLKAGYLAPLAIAGELFTLDTTELADLDLGPLFGQLRQLLESQ
jgi:predicted kinase